MSEEIVDTQLLQMGDRDTWDTLYSMACRRTYVVLSHLTSAPSGNLEELNQDVWLSAIQSIDRFDATSGSAVNWILGIARHKGLTYIRRQYTNRVVCIGGSDDLPPTTIEDVDSILAAERDALVRATLASLPENWQYVLRQKYHSGRTVNEIADLMESTAKAVESILSRARKRLRDLMRETINDLEQS